MIYDVLIVGAGPSGGYLAYLLSKEGFKVKIIDRYAFPRDKVCGGGISKKTRDLIDFDISPIVLKNISGAFLSYKKTKVITKDIKDKYGATVLRRYFDNFILQKAIEQGSKFQPNCSFINANKMGDIIQVKTSLGDFKTYFLVGADGVFSQVRNKIFGKNIVSYAPAYEALIYVDSEVIEKYEHRVLFDFGGMKRGYGWIFPKNDHLNIGVFSIFGSTDIKNDLKNFMSYYRTFDSYKKIVYNGFSIPLKNKQKIFEKGRVLLVGDAAGFAESFYGEGIYFAIKSAKVAAEALIKVFQTKEVGIYSKLVRRNILADLIYSELMAKLFYPVQRFGYFQMVRNENINNYFTDIITGDVSYKECFYKTILSFPYSVLLKKLKYSNLSYL